ncbi:MAG TPA: general secretion pathway protein GspB [Hydrogenophaga sp.]|uniref:general secretion pathway protein GspB n=1 Tax=Hydrogenophaga sp. TaxID=1904254 RepID=UPI002C9A6A81|nr:general secretion pathway protein GspB [Hydrogenophaga sp.]HMN91615.1 general secretion pathway protein GspB [Hydrogenophaga sp.]HMP10012.1 general secretion pathway protein GspB [Hydrogenophaga sp.]
MSYILDALQRADAERERGQVPGLHSRAQPLNVTPPERNGIRRWFPALVVALAGLGLLLLWSFWSRSVGVPPADSTVAAPAPRPEMASSPEPPEVAAVPPDPALPILAPRIPPAPPNASARATGEPGPAGATGTAGSAPASEAARAVPPAANGTPAPATARVPSFGELAPDVRSRLPQLSVSGATYSANPEHRMLIINGQVLQEGQEVQPGLRLESIGPRSAVLDHQGLRYSIGY